jgi:hypothetical protein
VHRSLCNPFLSKSSCGVAVTPSTVLCVHCAPPPHPQPFMIDSSPSDLLAFAWSLANKSSTVFLGGYRAVAGGPWAWVDGTNASNLDSGSLFGPGQPDNAGGVQDKLALLPPLGIVGDVEAAGTTPTTQVCVVCVCVGGGLHGSAYHASARATATLHSSLGTCAPPSMRPEHFFAGPCCTLAGLLR